MARIFVTPQAEADLAKIQDDIAERAATEIASRFVERLLAVIKTVAITPLASGRPVPKLGLNLRCHPFGNYNIYLAYDAAADTLHVVRVLHGRRRITARYFRP